MTSYIEVSIHSEPEDDDHHDLSDLELQQCNSSGSRQHLLQSITNLSKPDCLFTSAAQSSNESYGKAEKRKLMWATLFTVAFMTAEFVGGYLSGSLAIMTDAAHLLSDCISFVIAIISIWISNRPADTRMSFGYRRVEVLGALLSIFGIWALTAVLVVMSANRLIEGDYEIDADTMIIVAILGVVMNIAHGHSHGGHGHHSHSHSHGHSHISRPRSNLNVRAAIIHVIGDFIQSIGVLVAAIVIKFAPHLKAFDPICTFVFSLIVLITTVRIFRDSMRILVDAVPVDVSLERLSAELAYIEGVKTVHDLRVWSVSTGWNVMTVHLMI
ncbi:AGAP008982-PA, partial [Anopheles gambiae str. PEST]